MHADRNRTLTTTLAITPSTSHTRSNATGVENGTSWRGSGTLGSGSGSSGTHRPTLTTASAETVVCATGPASTCSCYTISRSTTTVTTDKITITVLANSTRLPPYPANGTRADDAGALGSVRRPYGQSSTGPFSTGSVTPSRGSVVYVVSSITTLVTVTTSSRGRSGTYTNPSSLTSTPLWTNSTISSNVTASRLFNHSTHLAPTITNRPWLNLHTLPPLPTNTRPRWLNTSLPRLNATATGRWLNTTRSSTVAPASNVSPELRCDPDTVPFTLQISQPGGRFDSWFLRVSGIGLLFTSVQEQASPFGIGGSGELCAMGLEDAEGVPYVAVVERQEGGVGGGSVWLAGRRTLDVRGDDYAALRCERAQELTCREGSEAQDWLGCGMQLALASDGAGPERGLNCTAVGLEVVAS